MFSAVLSISQLCVGLHCAGGSKRDLLKASLLINTANTTDDIFLPFLISKKQQKIYQLYAYLYIYRTILVNMANTTDNIVFPFLYNQKGTNIHYLYLYIYIYEYTL